MSPVSTAPPPARADAHLRARVPARVLQVLYPPACRTGADGRRTARRGGSCGGELRGRGEPDAHAFRGLWCMATVGAVAAAAVGGATPPQSRLARSSATRLHRVRSGASGVLLRDGRGYGARPTVDGYLLEQLGAPTAQLPSDRRVQPQAVLR